MNMTGIYTNVQQSIGAPEILNFTDLTGVQGYCSDEAAAEIRRRISAYSPHGIHFLDSGNYHYLSRFWLEKIEEPFDLLVFDHHTDMQRSAFGDILSCGSWILSVIESNPFLNKVCLLGADPAFRNTIDPACEGKYIWAEQEAPVLPEGKLPLYISIDKDVLAKDELDTDWDQGTMTVEEMMLYLSHVKKERKILGVDICGEPEADRAADEELKKSCRINEMICSMFTG